MNYARCAVCGYEYTSQLSLEISQRCPQCGDATKTLNPEEDVWVRVNSSALKRIIVDALSFTEALFARDPGLAHGRTAVKRMAERLSAGGADRLRCNWGELEAFFRWAEKYAISRLPAESWRLKGVISMARYVEGQYPKLRKLTGVTAEAEAYVQETLRNNLDGVKIKTTHPPPPSNPAFN